MPTTNGKEQVFNFGIKNNDSRPADTSADFLVTQNSDGTQGKIDPLNLPISTDADSRMDGIDLSIANLEDDKLDKSEYNDRYKGKYTSLSALESAYPTATAGDYAQVDEGAGFDIINYNWDDEEGWVEGGSGSSATNTDMLPEGSVNFYFTSARVLSTVLSGISFVAGGAIVSTDTFLQAFGKIQTQINDALVSIGLKQDLLVSGTNIKTVNDQSILGSGNIPIQLMSSGGIEGYGDSITVGQNSSPSTNAYINLLGTMYAKTVTNRAVSGRGIWEATKQHFANISTTSSVLAVVMAGFNDVRRGGSNIKTTNKIINGYRSILANHFLSSFTAAGTVTSSITRSGTWNIYNGISVGVKTNTGSYSNNNGGYIEYTFTDTNVVLGLVAGDGVTQIHASFTVTIDGIAQGSFTENNQTDGISDGSNDNARSAMCLIFTGLSEGTHVVRLTNTTTNNLIVDYFGHLKKPKFCAPVLVMQAPKMNATGYSIAPNQANDAIIDQLNADIASMINAFPAGYPIFLGETNSYYNVATGLDTDNIHPNNIGHRQIYTAAYTALKPLIVANQTDLSAGFILDGGATNRAVRVYPASTVNNDANTTFYPSSGTNVSSSVSVVPKGTGLSGSIKAQLGIYNTDYVAGASNYELMVFRASGTQYTIASGKGGSGTVRPILLSAGFADLSTNANQFWLMPSGNVLLGTATDNNTDMLQVSGSVRSSALKTAKINIDTASNASAGNAILVGGTVTVVTSAATSNSLIMLTRKTAGGTIGTYLTYTTTNGQFTINSQNPLETSTVTYLIIN